MKTLLSSRHYFLFILLITLISIFSCSEDKPTEPEDNYDNTVLATSNIGPNGGELKSEDFSLIVPTGTFLNDVEISLSTNNEYFLTDENSASETFIVSGIPSDFTNNLRVAIKYNGTLTDTSYIALALTNDESFLTDSLYAFSFLSTRDSAGFLVTEIPNSILNPISLNKNNSGHSVSSDRIQIMAKIIPSMSSYRYGYAVIHFPVYLILEAKNFAERMDQIVEIFNEDFGFDFKYDNTLENNHFVHGNVNAVEYTEWKWPIHFFIIEKWTPTTLDLSFNIFEDKKINYTAQKAMLAGSAKKASFRLAFELIKILNNTFNDNQSASFDNLLNAIRFWFETYLYQDNYEDPPAYLSENFPGVFNGFRGPDISKELATLIKYLVKYQSFNVSNFGPIFEDADSNNTCHYYGLVSKVDNYIIDWFPDYYEKYISGDVFSINSSSYLPHLTDWKINSKTDTLEVFTKNYADLSARRHLIELNHEFESETTSLILDAYKSSAANNEGVATIVFGVDFNNNLEHLVTGRADQVEIQNLKGFYKNGTEKFLVVVVNCLNNGGNYTGQTEIDLVAKIKSNSETGWDLSKSNRCMVKINLEGHMKEVKDGTTIEYNKDLGAGVNAAIGSFSGNTFVGDWNNNYDSDNFNYTGSVTVILNEDLTMVTSVIWTEDHTSYVDGSKVFASTYSFTGSNIPLYSELTPGVFQIYGPQTCGDNYLTQVTYSAHNYASSADISLKNHFCSDYSYININFWKE